MPIRVSKLLLSSLLKSHPPFETPSSNRSLVGLSHHFSSIHDRPARDKKRSDGTEDDLLRKFESAFDDDCIDDERRNKSHQIIPNRIPNRPLRGEKRVDRSEGFSLGKFKLRNVENNEKMKSSHQIIPDQYRNKPLKMGKRDDRSTTDCSIHNFDMGSDFDDDENLKKSAPISPLRLSNRPLREETRDDKLEESFLEKFKIGEEKEKSNQNAHAQNPGTEAKAAPESPPQDADEIFRKMKESGLIPNAVAMLDGLCKDGLVQEAMKLFGLMREKGTIPEVVIFTAVVEGFCKAQKLDDAKRIFRKMQNNGITPNAFSYAVLIQGLCKGSRLEDAADFCIEMLEAGHSPNVVTFSGLVDGFCRDRGVEEAQKIIGRLREKGFLVDEKAVRTHLEKKGPLSPLVWEAIFGKKCPQRLF